MTSNNPTGQVRGTYRVRDICDETLTVSANPDKQLVYLVADQHPFILDMRAAHRLACVVLLAIEQALAAEQVETGCPGCGSQATVDHSSACPAEAGEQR